MVTNVEKLAIILSGTHYVELMRYVEQVVIDLDFASQHATALAELNPEAFDEPVNPNRLTSIEREALVTDGIASQPSDLLVRFLQCPSDMVTVSDRVGIEFPDAWAEQLLHYARQLGGSK